MTYMLERLGPLVTSAVLACGIAAAPLRAEDAPTADTVVATVNGTDITLGHMIVLRAGLPAQFAQLPADVLYQGVLDQIIQQTLMAQSYEGDMPKAGRLSLENEERAILASEVMEAWSQGAGGDDALQAAYEAKYVNVGDVTEYNASHILVETREAAEALIVKLDEGADFATLARDSSTGPSGPSGGELGWFSAGMMVEPFQKAVEAMEPGTVSKEPVETQFGWHVLRLNETRVKERPTLDEVRAELQQELSQKAVQDHVAKLTETAQIDRATGDALDPSVLDQFDLLKD
jgi:peptidyl-prolyl cis-trans isomerase C